MSRTYVQQLSFRLSYADCDPAQIVYYAAYFHWFERTSTEWWVDQGYRIDELPQQFGVSLVSRSAGCEYLAPTRVLDRLVCKMYFSRVGRSSATFAFDVDRIDDGVRVAEGFNTLVTVDAAGGRPAPIPPQLRALMVSGAGGTDGQAGDLRAGAEDAPAGGEV
jgi:YbgC/YbaW family acyl-CoA thioester hydrolase